MDIIAYIPKSWRRRRSGLVTPVRECTRVRGHVVLALFGPDGKLKDRQHSHNLITNDGDLWMAQRVAGEATTDSFQTGIMELGTGGNAPAKTSDRSDLTPKLTPTKTMAGNFQTNETDVDNAGAGAVDKVTWLGQWAAGEATGTITFLIITNSSPTASENILTLATGFSTVKGAGDTLKAFVNHELLGV